MLNSDVLESGVGLCLFFLLVSLLCSALREGVEAVMKSRARDLERGLRALLDDPRGLTMTRSLLNHGQLASLSEGEYDPARLRSSLLGVLQLPWGARRNFPSYLPSNQFAAAFTDVVARAPGDWPYPVACGPVTVAGLRQAAAFLPSARLQRVVLSAADQAGDDLASFRMEIAQWFDGSMDRVSGWYKRRTQILLLVIGFVAAAVLNLDALTVARRLATDESLRHAAVAAAAPALAQTPEEGLAQTQATLNDVGYPIGWMWTNSGPLPAPQVCTASTLGCAGARVTAGTILLMFVGWAVTALAASFGAPFWFDMLSRIALVRSTVPASTPAEFVAPVVPASTNPSPVQALPPLVPPLVPPLLLDDDAPTWRAGFVNAEEVAL